MVEVMLVVGGQTTWTKFASAVANAGSIPDRPLTLCVACAAKGQKPHATGQTDAERGN